MIYRTKTILLFIEQMDFFFPQRIAGRHAKVSVISCVRSWVATQRQNIGKILLKASEKIDVNDQAWFFSACFSNTSGWYSTVKIDYTLIKSFLLQEQGNYKRSGA